MTLLASTVDQPIDPAKFTLSRFKLNDGDRLVDHIAGTVQSKEGRTFVDDDEKRAPRPQKGIGLFMALILLAVSAIAVGIIGMILRSLLK